MSKDTIEQNSSLSPEDTEAARRVLNSGFLAYGINNRDSTKAKEAMIESLRSEFPHLRDKTDSELINPIRFLGANCFKLLGIKEPGNAKSYQEAIDSYTKSVLESHQKSL